MKNKFWKKYGYAAVVAGCAIGAVLLFGGCGKGKAVEGASVTSAPKQEEITALPPKENGTDAGSGVSDKVSENANGTGQTQEDSRTRQTAEAGLMLLPAKSGVTLTPGSMAKGVFDDSRESISVLCEEEDGALVLYVDGERALETAKNDTILFYDINTDDAFLELIVAKEFSGMESAYKKQRKVNAYRVHSGKLTEIAAFPLRAENSFLISDWKNLSFRNGVVELCWPEDIGRYAWEYCLMPQGFLAKKEQPLTPVRIDGELLFLPSEQVAVSEDYPLAIAWVDVERPSDNWTPNTSNYDIYRSTDGGVTWSLACAGFLKETADFDAIYILDASTAVTCFDISGVTCQRRAEISVDGGVTWRTADKKEYWFLYQGGEDLAASFGKTDTKKKEESTVQTAAVTTENIQMVLPAKSKVVLTPGSMAKGIFDDSREVIRVFCEEKNGQQVIFVDGKQALTVEKDKKIMLFDMEEQDAYLELLIMEALSDGEKTGAFGLSQNWKVNAYRVHPGELTAVEFLFEPRESSFVAEEWNFAFSRNRIQIKNLGEASGDYRITPLGYLVRAEQNVIPIVADGKVHKIPSGQIAIYKDCSLAVAFEEQWGLMNSVHYNVYHSTDGGVTWSLAAEDFTIASAPFEHIYIVDDATVFVCFGISGVTGVRSGCLSEDGGCTWSSMDVESYGFLGIRDTAEPLW